MAAAGLPALTAVRLANIGARAVSASFNFTVNRKAVFKSGGNAAVQAVKYAVLAAGILVVNTMLLGFLTGSVGIAPMAAKIITEAVLFIISWILQKKIVFSAVPGCGRRDEIYVQKAQSFM